MLKGVSRLLSIAVDLVGSGRGGVKSAGVRFSVRKKIANFAGGFAGPRALRMSDKTLLWLKK